MTYYSRVVQMTLIRDLSAPNELDQVMGICLIYLICPNATELRFHRPYLFVVHVRSVSPVHELP